MFIAFQIVESGQLQMLKIDKLDFASPLSQQVFSLASHAAAPAFRIKAA
jgi:hypothetical protein